MIDETWKNSIHRAPVGAKGVRGYVNPNRLQKLLMIVGLWWFKHIGSKIYNIKEKRYYAKLNNRKRGQITSC